jgi:hypothetical protein
VSAPERSPLERMTLPPSRRGSQRVFDQLRAYAVDLEETNADLLARLTHAEAVLADDAERLRRVAAERDDATLKGERATRLLLNALDKEKTERVASVECMAQTFALLRELAEVHLGGRELVAAAVGRIDLALHELEMGE